MNTVQCRQKKKIMFTAIQVCGEEIILCSMVTRERSTEMNSAKLAELG